MSTGSVSVDELLALVDAAVYADVFDAAVTLDELHRYARIRVDRGTLEQALTEDPSLGAALVQSEGVVALRDRAELIAARVDRLERAGRLRRRARRVARVLRHTPFVRGVALTGSVAAGDARSGADVDMLLVVAPGRLGTVFALLGTASRLVGRRVFCPNFYLSEESLTLQARTVYVAHELAQAKTLVGDATLLLDANGWVKEMFPNLTGATGDRRRLRAGGLGQRMLEAPLRKRLGERVERWARGLAHDRLRAHHHGVVPDEIVRQFDAGQALRFHRGGVEHSVPLRYEARRDDVAVWLEEAVIGRSS